VYASRHAVFVFNSDTGPRFDRSFDSAVEAEKHAENLSSQRIPNLVVGPEQPQQRWHRVKHIDFEVDSFSLQIEGAPSREIQKTELVSAAILDFEDADRGTRALLLTTSDSAKFEFLSNTIPRAFVDDVIDRCIKQGALIRHRRLNEAVLQMQKFSGETIPLALGIVDAIDCQSTNLMGPLHRIDRADSSLALDTPRFLGWLWYFAPLLSIPVALLEFTALAISASWETAIHPVALVLWASPRFLWSQWMRNSGQLTLPRWPLNASEKGRKPNWPELGFDLLLIALGIIFRNSDGWPGVFIASTAMLAIITFFGGAYTIWGLPNDEKEIPKP
jgi:hypothetical protein